MEHLRPVEYHRVLVSDKRRIGRGILAIVLLVGGMQVFALTLTAVAAYVDTALGTEPRAGYTPLVNAAGAFSIALLIPWSMLIQRWLYGVTGRTLHSVAGVFRMAVLGRAVLVLVPVWAVYLAVLTALEPSAAVEWSLGDMLFMFVVTLVVVPLQTAGEEYGYRGLIFRVTAGWARGARSALVLGVGVSAVLFTVIHLSTDLWLNIQFLAVGIAFALITWRTGGLETTVVLHAANNVLGLMLALVLHADLSAAPDRSSGVGSVAYLIPVALLAVITAVIWYRTRRTGPPLTPATETVDESTVQSTVESAAEKAETV